MDIATGTAGRDLSANKYSDVVFCLPPSKKSLTIQIEADYCILCRVYGSFRFTFLFLSNSTKGSKYIRENRRRYHLCELIVWWTPTFHFSGLLHINVCICVCVCFCIVISWTRVPKQKCFTQTLVPEAKTRAQKSRWLNSSTIFFGMQWKLKFLFKLFKGEWMSQTITIQQTPCDK